MTLPLFFFSAGPPPAGNFSITLRANPPGQFNIALSDLPRFVIALKARGAGTFDIPFVPPIELAVTLAAVADFEMLGLGPTLNMDVTFTATADMSMAQSQGEYSPTLIAVSSTGTGPFGIATDGTDIYVANYGSSTVTRFNSSFQVAATIDMPPNSGPAGVVYDGESIWVTLALARRLAKINIATNQVAALVPLASYPRMIAFDGTDLWVTENTAGPNGLIDVTVTNPTPGGGTSNHALLSVTGADPSPVPS